MKNYTNSFCGGADALTSLRLPHRSLRICSVGAPSHCIHHARKLNSRNFSTDSRAPQPLSLGTGYDLKYDAWNRLVEVKVTGGSVVATHRYDGNHRRLTKAVGANTQHYYYDNQWRVLEERVNTSTTAERRFVWGMRHADDLVMRETIAGTVVRHYVLHDGFNVTAVIDPSGAVQERYGYDGFGKPRYMDKSFGSRSSSSYGWETLFGAYRYDLETGLYQVRYRYLHPNLGRWINRDPIGELAGTNLYRYVDNAAISVYDPLGLRKTNSFFRNTLEIYGAFQEGSREGLLNELKGVGSLLTGLFNLGQEITKTSFDVAESYFGEGENFESGLFNWYIGQVLDGKSDAQIAGDVAIAMALDASGYTFATQTYKALQSGDYEQFSQSMGQFAFSTLLTASTLGASTATAAEGTSVLFGQRRIGPAFSTSEGVPSYLSGRQISDVAADLRSGILSADQLPINAFRGSHGELITINNRTLAALSEASLKPTRINIVTATRNELLRLTERPIINSPIPGPSIPVTRTISDPTVLRVITIP